MSSIPEHSTGKQQGVDTQSHPRKKFLLLATATLGVIYGDIGTSPLYTIKECFSGRHGVIPTPENVLGILSLIFWSLVLVVGLKYVIFILQADNNGEGGIFSLLALLKSRQKNDSRRWAFLTILGVLGSALLYGDGVITPAISVLSAIEGLKMATDAATDYIIPLTCLVLIALFLMQRQGASAIGRIFGPVMILWFLVLGTLGLRSILENPGILQPLTLYRRSVFLPSIIFMALQSLVPLSFVLPEAKRCMQTWVNSAKRRFALPGTA